MKHAAHTCQGIAVAAAALLVAGCGSSSTSGTADTTTAPTTTTAAPATFVGEQARAVGAVDRLARALSDGDVARLCRPGVIFTAAVVAEFNSAQSCEQNLEDSSLLTRPTTLTVVKMTYAPDLATVEVRPAGAAAFPLDIERTQGRWLVSFSSGDDPLAALAAL